LGWVLRRQTVVDLIWDTVAVTVAVARVTEPIPVEVLLLAVGYIGAVVIFADLQVAVGIIGACVADSIAVDIALV